MMWILKLDRGHAPAHVPARRARSTIGFVVPAFVLLVGCAQHVSGTAQSQPQLEVAKPAETKTLVEKQPAQPLPKFDDFATVVAEKFYVPLRGGPTYQFVTATGVRCEINLNAMGCYANFPDPDTPANTVCMSAIPKDQATSHPPYTYVIQYVEGECARSSDRTDQVLEVGTKLVADWGPAVGQFTCAAGTRELVTCIDNHSSHGFVLQPTGSWTF